MKALSATSPASKLLGFVKPVMKNGSWMAGGVALSLVATVAAQQYTTTPTAEECALTAAMQAAVNDKVRMIAMTSSAPEKYFDQNCLGDLSFASIDLSNMIPDPIGLLTGAAMTALDNLKKAAVGKVCAAARNSMGDTIGRYNAAITAASGGGAGVGGLIDTAIAQQGQRVTDQFNMNYSTPSAPVGIAPSAPQGAWNAPGVPQPMANEVAGGGAAQAAPVVEQKTVGGSIFSPRR